ncbi:MAG: nitroreductase family protein [Sphaerochaetaceae bacterium]|jgi:nitroreductase|nr:nitroreductase family protein [Sphaerochaetaceae bacterium]
MNGTEGAAQAMNPGFLDGVDTFLDTPVTPDEMREILGAAGYAPSIANCQPWEFIVTVDAEAKMHVAGTLLDVQFRPIPPGAQEVSWFGQAPVILTVLMNRLRANAKSGPVGANRFALMDIGMAVACMFQAGKRLGIGGTIIREFDPDAVCRLFSLPSHMDPVLLLAIGHMATEPKRRPRLYLDEYVRWDADGLGSGV